MFDLEHNIRAWSDHLRTRGTLKETDLLELENHLRDEIEDLMNSGLEADEAFIISVKRLGNVNAVSHEYAKIYSASFWKHLLTNQGNPLDTNKNRSRIVLVIIFSLIAGTLAKIPELFGYHLWKPGFEFFYLKNSSLFILPLVALYFLLSRKPGWKYTAIVMGSFILSTIIINVYPSIAPFHTTLLTVIHLPLFLWLIVGIAYTGRGWKNSMERMDFLRFSGEAVIYGGLVFGGILALGAFIMFIFRTINIDISRFVTEYLFIYGAGAAVMVAIYLVEAKKSIVENFAPVLAKIFSPLFLLSMLAFLIAMLATGNGLNMERDFLIGFDLMLVAVLALVVYVISARGLNASTGFFDYLNLALIIMALIIDFVALFAIVYRLSEFGISPNKLAALGENLVLLVNLSGLAFLYTRFFHKKMDFGILERWQTAYLYVYAVWLALVAFVFPLIFGFH